MPVSNNKLGKLYLVPTPLDFNEQQLCQLNSVLPVNTINIASRLTYWICENSKSQRAFLKRINLQQQLQVEIQQQHICQIPKEAHKNGDHLTQTAIKQEVIKQLLEPALNGYDIGLTSEAGMPAIADPGSSIVKMAHQLNISVVPLIGPNSILLALAASGLNGQNFAFVGYLAQDKLTRDRQIKQLEQLCKSKQQAQIFIETPYRNQALFASLLEQLQSTTMLSIALAITLEQQFIKTQTVAAWRQYFKTKQLFSQKNPAIFIIN